MGRTLLMLLLAASLGAEETSVRVVATLPGGANSYYVGNRAPLEPSPLMKLPLGSVRAEGWLRRQLELMAEGFTGRLSQISRFCQFEGNAWADPRGEGENGWEELPYWLKGYYNLGHQLQDRRILAEARRWLEAVLKSQRPNGYFGSRGNLDGERTSAAAAVAWPKWLERTVPDLWPNMVMLYPLRSLYEATGERRILDFMTKYFRWQMTAPLERFVPFSWQHWRAGDNLEAIYWLYNRTGERWLLELARVNHERTADWVGGVPTWHVVNIAQCFREPGQYYQQTRDIRYLKASERVYETVRGIYGQVPGGMYGADENARPGFTGPRQGTETCALVEMLYSDELLASITGNPVWADRAEEVAFNSLPCAMTPDLKGLHYLTAPNQIQLDRQDKSPMIENGGDMFSYNPHQYRCCQHNVAFGWPYYAEHAWMATPGNGLAAVFYVASRVKAKAGDGGEVEIRETTEYPFDETVNFAISTAKPVRFPLALRIPGWCERPRISVNGQPLTLPKAARGWAVVERTWQEGDRVKLELPMKIRVAVWSQNRNTVSVERGPLEYSLRIGERWEKKGGTEEWPGFEVYPTTPWNYGLVVDAKNPEASFEVVKGKWPPAAQPFALDNAPVALRAKGKRILQWKQEPNGLVGEVQPGPVRSDQPAEDITLIPMGCARLRISAFPQIGEGAEAREWKEAPPLVFASYTSHFEPPTAVSDEIVPASSADTKAPRFTWGERRGTAEWIEYYYSRPRRVRGVEVYWVDDSSGPYRLPAAWEVLYWSGKRWEAVQGATGYEIRKDRFSRVRFSPLETSRVRLKVQLQERYSAGVLELRVGE